MARPRAKSASNAPPLFSQRELARMWEVTDATMSRWLKGLEPDEESSGERRFTHERARRHISGTELDPTAERARLQKAQADHQEMVNAQKRGELIDAEVAAAEWVRTLTAAKANLLSIPRKAAPMVVGMTSIAEIEQHIDDAVRDAMARAVDSAEGVARVPAAAEAHSQ